MSDYQGNLARTCKEAGDQASDFPVCLQITWAANMTVAGNAGLNYNYPWVLPSAVPGLNSASSPAVTEPVTEEVEGRLHLTGG